MKSRIHLTVSARHLRKEKTPGKWLCREYKVNTSGGLLFTGKRKDPASSLTLRLIVNVEEILKCRLVEKAIP